VTASSPTPAARQAATTGNLPASLTTFIGRDAELVKARRLLEAARLVTLTGPGGVGKSRLAVQVAASLTSEFADGAWLVELAGLSDPGLAPDQVLSALGGAEAPRQAPTESLTRHLATRRLLLVLDNCEHLISACAVLADTLLRACPGLKILATSRELLGVSGETAWPVPPLSTPEGDWSGALDALLECESVRLFVDRARRAAPDLVVDDANARHIVQICRRLDGVPLALELAAARARTLSLGEIAQRLDDRFRLLVGGPRSAPARHQTLRAALDWSYEALTPSERSLFVGLAVFAGGFTLEAATAVGTLDGPELLDTVASLVEKSLVVADRSSGTTRYHLLETVRQYGLERLVENGQAETARTRHLEWAVQLAETAGSRLHGPEQEESLRVLETEHDNLRAALDWAAAGSRIESGIRLAASLGRFWEIHGHLSEGRARLETWAGAGGTPPELRARVLTSAAVLAQRQLDAPAARRLYEEALVIRRALDDLVGTAEALHGLGNLAYMQGDVAAAEALFEENLAVARNLNDRRIEAASLLNLGVVTHSHYLRGRAPLEEVAPRATAYYEQALEIYRELGDRHGMALALENIGAMVQFLGDSARSLACHTESLALRRALGDKIGIAASARFLAYHAFRSGDYGRARGLHEEALDLEREIGNPRQIAEELTALAEVLHNEGETLRARHLLEESAVLSRRFAERFLLGRTLWLLGVIAMEDGDFDVAEQALEESRATAAADDNQRGVMWALAALARVARARGDHMTARARCQEAANMPEAAETGGALSIVTAVVAGLAVERGDFVRAGRLSGAADGLRRPMEGAVMPEWRTEGEQRDVAVAKEALGADAFNAAWSEGNAMSPADIVAYALDDPGSVHFNRAEPAPRPG
jgi:predicted ATPase